jgi:hypothetical protein
MKSLVISFVAVVIACCGMSVAVNGQTETATGVQIERDLNLLRKDLRSEKKKIIAMNIPLTEVEATKFWPLYDQYSNEIAKQNDEFWGVIKDYAAKQKVITDTEALAMIKRWSDIQVRRDQVRQKYVSLIGKVVPGKKTALFFQIDRRLHALLDLQVSAQIPLLTQETP